MATLWMLYASLRFQFTPLREGRLAHGQRRTERKRFQFTPLREGRLFRPLSSVGLINFNSRPCVRGDLVRLAEGEAGGAISIHAPA